MNSNYHVRNIYIITLTMFSLWCLQLQQSNACFNLYILILFLHLPGSESMWSYMTLYSEDELLYLEAHWYVCTFGAFNIYLQYVRFLRNVALGALFYWLLFLVTFMHIYLNYSILSMINALNHWIRIENCIKIYTKLIIIPMKQFIQ